MEDCRRSCIGKKNQSMNILKSKIFVGDLVRACSNIGLFDKQNIETIKSLLGFEYIEKPEKSESHATGISMDIPETVDNNIVKKQILEIKNKHNTEISESKGSNQEERILPFDFEHEKSEFQNFRKMNYLWHEEKVPPGFKTMHIPLLPKRNARAIIGKTLSLEREMGIVDITRIVNVIASCNPICRIPQLKVPSLLGGCQVLIDIGPGMEPFSLDRLHLVKAIKDIIGDEQIDIQYFKGSPLSGVKKEDAIGYTSYSTPVSGTSVIAITDLCIADVSYNLFMTSPDDWLQLNKILETSGCPLMIYAPYPPSRWPKKLFGTLPIIQWDRGITLSKVCRVKERK